MEDGQGGDKGGICWGAQVKGFRESGGGGLASNPGSEPGLAPVALGFSALKWRCWALRQPPARGQMGAAWAPCFPRADRGAVST